LKLRDTARFSTICIHAGQTPDPSTGAIITPIYQTSTYVQEALGKHKGYEYARTQNPTRAALEANVAAIENGKAAFAFASGMAAEGAVMTLLESGDHVVVTDNTYGGTYRLFERVLRKYQLDSTYVDSSNTDAIAAAIGPKTRAARPGRSGTRNKVSLVWSRSWATPDTMTSSMPLSSATTIVPSHSSKLERTCTGTW